MKWHQIAKDLHENSRAIELTQTVGGRLAMWFIASGFLAFHEVSPIGPLALGLVFVFPDHRRLILSLGAAGMILDRYIERQEVVLGPSMLTAALETPGPWIKVLVFAVTILIGLYAVFQIAKRLDRFPTFVKRYPLLLLHSGIGLGFALMMVFPGLAAASELVPWLTWRISYLLQYGVRGAARKTKFSDHLFYLWPIVASSGSPYGKGLAYLSSHEATDKISNAKSQLAGLKCLVLATLWELMLRGSDKFVFRDDDGVNGAIDGWNLGLPRLEQAILLPEVGIFTAWAAAFVELVRVVLYYATIGHVIVGFLRLSGFNIFRNTYKPLLSESIVEFWGRFNYYFKEAMVDFFFYPTYLRCRRLGARFRLFVAVFAAAFLGNMYYHMLISPYLLLSGSLTEIWEVWGPRTVYCFFLAVGVWVSMLRQQSARKKAVEKSWGRRLLAIAGVWVFYSVIHVWNLNREGLNWSNRIDFCLALIGL